MAMVEPERRPYVNRSVSDKGGRTRTGRRLLLFVSAAQVVPALFASAATAQRADANAVTSAEDAFGLLVNGQSIGLYTIRNIRNFDPLKLGNIRIDGLYFDRQGEFPDQLVESATIRVGMNTKNYPFPAPSGIADIHLRDFNGQDQASITVGVGAFLSPYFGVDFAKELVSKKLYAAGGLGSNPMDRQLSGGYNSYHSAGLNLIFQPTPAVTLSIFGGRVWEPREYSDPILYLRGEVLPPPPPRRLPIGQVWANGVGGSTNVGLRSSWTPQGGWRAKLGAFYSEKTVDEGFDQILDGIGADGQGAYVTSVYRKQRAQSLSGEARVGYVHSAGRLHNTVEVSLRGRSVFRAFGGEEIFGLGPASLTEARQSPQPTSTGSRPQNRDTILQAIGGPQYRAEVDKLGLFTIGLQRSHYYKEFQSPGAARSVDVSNNTLVNASVAVSILPALVAYGGYSRGLEEGGVAPAEAVNRYQLLPIIESRQYEAGVRSLLGSTMTDIAVFEISKPYAARDEMSVFRLIGQVRNRGLEGSVSSQPVDTLKVILGFLLVNPQVRMPGISGTSERRPVGVPTRRSQVNVNYSLPMLAGLSLDGRMNHTGGTVVTADGSIGLPDQFSIDLGARLPFRAWSSSCVLRFQVTNVLDEFIWQVDTNGGLTYFAPRTFNLSLTAGF
jgi:iron complex outermembrane receptor protein